MNGAIRLTLPVQISSLDHVMIPERTNVLLPDPDRAAGARVVAVADLTRQGEHLMASFDLPRDCGVHSPERIECWTVPMVVRGPWDPAAGGRPAIHGIMLRRIVAR